MFKPTDVFMEKYTFGGIVIRVIREADALSTSNDLLLNMYIYAYMYIYIYDYL